MNADPKNIWGRIILHADMDAFFASVEQLDNPDLKGRPVVVGGTGKRGVVSAASYEAREYSIKSAMPVMEARRLCPEAVFVSPRFARYKDVSTEIMSAFKDFSPLVEPLSLDEAFLDMTGAAGLFGGPREMAMRVKRSVRDTTGGLTISIGCADTKFVAKVASDENKPDGITVVPPDEVESFLRPLPVSRLWGAGPKTVAILREMGLERVGDVADCKPEVLESTLGALGLHLHRLARGIDPRPVEPCKERKSVGAEYTLERDIKGAAAIRPHLRRAADEVTRRLRAKGLVGAGVRVKLKTARFRLYTRQTALMEPTNSSDEIFMAGDGLLDEFNLKSPMRLVGLAVFDLSGIGGMVQQELFSPKKKFEKRKLDQTMDSLREKFGENVIIRGGDLKSKNNIE